MNLEKFGRELRRLRAKAGQTQQGLADLVPVSSQLLSRWENGRKRPGRQSVIRLIEIFFEQLLPDEAWEWAWQAGHELGRQELQKIFPYEVFDAPPKPRLKPAQHPATPATYINRPVIETKILGTLPPQGAGKCLVLFGQGGSGKSTLAAWTAETLQDHYPDGVIWVEYENVLDAQHRVADSFQVRLAGVTLAERAGELRSLLRGKQCLLILEDVWDNPDLAHLKIYNDTCPLLITSRDKTLTHIFETQFSIEVEGLTPAEGRILLQNLVGGDLTTNELDELVKTVERSPLALTLIGSQLRNGYSPLEILSAVGTEDGSLDILDLGPPKTRARSLSRCFDLSYHNLPEARFGRYFAQLCCFVGHFAVNIAAAIWGVRLNEARYILGQLRRFMLVIQDERGYRLHPLLRDYARQRLATDWPDLIPVTFSRHAAYYFRHYLYCPELTAGVTEPAPNVEQRWGDIVAGVKWAAEQNPRLAAQAMLLAHTERGALLEAVGPSLFKAVETYLEQTVDRSEQAILSEALGDLYLLAENIETGLAHFERASRLWQTLEDGLASSRAELRVAGSHLLRQEPAAAAVRARQAQALLQQSLPFQLEDDVKADRLFYWFNMVYNPLVRWANLPEADVLSLAQLADRTKRDLFKARGLTIYQLWCTTKAVPRSAEIRQRGRELACEAYVLWRQSGRKDRADDEISFTQYRLKNRYSRWVTARFARRRSQTTPRIGSSQLGLLKKKNPILYWWFGATVKQRIDWLSWMLPRFLGVDNRPIHPATRTRLKTLHSDGKAYRWVEDILNIGMLGGTGRRVMMEQQPPADHFLNGPEWRVLSGQRAFALVGQEAKALVQRYLTALDETVTQGGTR